jgi:hypothetical protein
MKTKVITSHWITWKGDLNEMLHLIEFKYYLIFTNWRLPSSHHANPRSYKILSVRLILNSFTSVGCRAVPRAKPLLPIEKKNLLIIDHPHHARSRATMRSIYYSKSECGSNLLFLGGQEMRCSAASDHAPWWWQLAAKVEPSLTPGAALNGLSLLGWLENNIGNLMVLMWSPISN